MFFIALWFISNYLLICYKLIVHIVSDIVSNICPTKNITLFLDDKSQHEMLYGEEPIFIMMKTFGCLWYVSNVNPHKNKFDPRVNKVVFLRYKWGMKGYITLYNNSKYFSGSRHFPFYELELSFLIKQKYLNQTNQPLNHKEVEHVPVDEITIVNQN